ncbi:MAG TPA: hypothetical protein VKB34_21805, partial [Povalibacter sp.]|nr:hypothetical protein [Povalibacter sp.]
EQATVAEYTARKYQPLFDDLQVPEPDAASLHQALLAREQIAGQAAGTQREQALAEADQRIRSLLHPADFAIYQALADSDLEQFQLEQFAGGVSNVAPLDAEERKAILRTKLAYKQRFQQLVQDAGLLRADLGREEREYALGVASRALADYQHDYLQEIRQYIANDEQFALLANYEKTEFTDQLAKLRE